MCLRGLQATSLKKPKVDRKTNGMKADFVYDGVTVSAAIKFH